MKTGYAIAFLVTALVLCYESKRAGKSENPIAGVIQKLLMAAMWAVLANLVAMISGQESVCMVAYCVFFTCIDWLLYFVLLFAVTYTGCPAMRWPRWPVILVMLLDSASMMTNFIFGHAFSCVPVYTAHGELFYRIHAGIFYNIHLALSYFLVLSALIVLLIKAWQVPDEYRLKYIVIIAIFSITVAADAGYVFFQQTVNFSILFFAFGGIALYYYAVVYSERELLSSSMRMVASGMSEALIIFDEKNRCIYMNESAIQIFGRIEHTYKEAKHVFMGWCKAEHLLGKENYGRDIDFYFGEEELHLKVEYRCIQDKERHHLGSFFVLHDHTAVLNDLKRERYRATHDSLTGLYNKEHFFERATDYMKQHPEEEFLILCTDVKNFKLINDLFGNDTGDEVLIKIARAIQEKTRPGEIFGRIEGDRFGLLMRKRDYHEDIFADGSEAIVNIDCAVPYPVTVHVGIYEIVDRSVPFSVMCDRAFLAINSINDKYSKRFVYYDAKLRDSILEEQELNGQLEEAIASGQFQIYLQPQIEVEHRRVPGAEVLVRWKHPKKGLLMPGSFIEVLEGSGMIVKLDRHVWEMACKLLQTWKMQGRDDMYLSVNISTRDFYFIDIYQTFTDLIKEYDIEPQKLKLEITETAVMMDLEKQLELIGKLRSAGFVVEMDDFGSGYSSLNMLKEICVDILKVDMAFLEQKGDEARGRKILKAVVEMAKELGMSVITEGVETEEQVEYLTQIGCDMFQGYYFARPMEVEMFEEKYMRNNE